MIGVRSAALATVAAMAVGLGGAGVASADPTGGAAGRQWTASHDSKQKKYAGVSIQTDVPIRMSDGTVLRADIYRPADARKRPIATKTPTIVNLTPYTKLLTSLGTAVTEHPVLKPFMEQVVSKIHLTGPLRGADDLIGTMRDGGAKTMMADYDLIRSGYTQVVVDVRGTGFSQGKWQTFKSREQKDTVEVINWAARQKWSDGKIGMSGVSYSGINQIYAAKMAPKALKAIFPVEPGGDLIRDVVAPGGALGVGFLPLWLTLVNATKLIPNVASMMTGNFDWKWLADRMSEPGTFYPQLFAALSTPNIASIPPNLKSLLETNSDERSSWLSGADKITVPTMIYGGWFDLFTNTEVRAFNQIPLPPSQKKLIMGDGYHLTIGARQSGKNGTPPRLDVLQKAWFDKWLKGIDNGIDRYSPVTLKQVGDKWISADQFPRAGMERQAFGHSAVRGTRRFAEGGKDHFAWATDGFAGPGHHLLAGQRTADHRRGGDPAGMFGRRPVLRTRRIDVHQRPGAHHPQRVRLHQRAPEHRPRRHRRLLGGNPERCRTEWHVEGHLHRSAGDVAARLRCGQVRVRRQRRRDRPVSQADAEFTTAGNPR